MHDERSWGLSRMLPGYYIYDRFLVTNFANIFSDCEYEYGISHVGLAEYLFLDQFPSPFILNSQLLDKRLQFAVSEGIAIAKIGGVHQRIEVMNELETKSDLILIDRKSSVINCSARPFPLFLILRTQNFHSLAEQ